MDIKPSHADLSAPFYDDEISISELLMKLWAKRGLIVALPLILLGLTVAGLLLSKATASDSVSYYVALVGIEKNSYPNSSQFSPQDLLNPEVTSQLAKTFEIAEPGELARHIRVDYGTPLSQGIDAEFRAALAANSKARPDEIAAITAQYKDRVDNAAQRGLRISVDYVSLGIDKQTAIEIAYELPKTWNEVYANQFNIFLNTGISGMSAVTESADIATAVGAMETNLHLKTIKHGVNFLREDSRFRVLRTTAGWSPADLRNRIVDFESIYFEPIYASSFAAADSLALVYRRDLSLRLKEVEVELDELQKRIGTITELQNSNSGTRSQNSNNSGSQVQLESDALGQLVSLSRQASLSEYLQESFELRLELVREKAELLTRLEKMGDYSATSKQTGTLLSAVFLEDARSRYLTIKADYHELLETAKRIAAAETPRLYRVVTNADSQQQLLEKRDLLFLALSVVLGGMFAVITALVWPSRQT